MQRDGKLKCHSAAWKYYISFLPIEFIVRKIEIEGVSW